MQIKNWNDLTYILALKRGGSYSEAARILKVDDTTVSRRIAALQAELDTQLFVRLPNGSLQMTGSGEAILSHIDSIEKSVGLIEDLLGSRSTECVGTVRITSVSIVVNRILTPHIGQLLDKNPELTVVLIPDNRDLSLSYREADLAIRLARPSSGGSYVKARRIGQLNYSVYAAKSIHSKKVITLPWITYDDALAHLPTAKWINSVISGDNSSRSQLKVHDVETALQATLTGSGRSLLPDAIAMGDNRLRRLSIKADDSLPSRDLWLLGHADQANMHRIVTVSRWIDNVMSKIADTASR